MSTTATPANDAETPLVLRQDDDGVTILTLNRPRALNALSLPMLQALRAALDEIAEDHSVRAVILRGEGRAFCAGHDLKEITAHRDDPDGGRGFFEALFESCTDVMLAIRNLPVIVVAEVQGIATAAGCQLVSTCDMAVASSEARFGVNGVNAGLFCSTPMVALSRNVPRKLAMEMLTLGEMIDAQRALHHGLVNAVVQPEDLEFRTSEMARRATQKSRAVVALGKEAFYRQAELGVEDAYGMMSRVIVDNLMMRDAEIGISCFIDKKTPEWEDR